MTYSPFARAYSFGAESGKEESMTAESFSAPFLRC
jgi:hypothetical protein